MRIYSRALLLASVFFLLSAPARAGGLIRDAEIENTLHAYGRPIFEAAGLEPDSIHFFIINDPAVNAFVAGGKNIFIHTGLLLVTETPEMLMGVLAHETGHIAGGHLARGAEQLRNASIGSVLTYVLGAAAAVGGGGKGAAAVLAAGQQTMLRKMLSFSRANEESADQAALGYLDTAGVSARGLLKVLEILKREESRQFGTPAPYLRTHPLNASRVSHIRAHVDVENAGAKNGTAAFENLQPRLVAKLYGFLKSPAQTFQKYPASDHSVPARYARAVAYYKIPELEKSLAEIDSLLKESPSDPYFNELKGQILFENGKVAAAMQSYATAVRLLPNAPLIRADYARTLLANGKTTDAIRELQRALDQDNSNGGAWRLLATAYGKTGNLGMSHLALAEEAALGDDKDAINRHVTEALKTLPEKSPARIRAMDLRHLADKKPADEKSDGEKTE